MEQVREYELEEIGVRVVCVPLVCDSALSKRERERQTERRLIEYLFGEEEELLHDEKGKPYLKHSSIKISISHTDDYLCLALSSTGDIGIDIEKITPRLERVKSMFLTEKEIEQLPKDSLLALALCWSAKEAMYKLVGQTAGAYGEHVILDMEQINGVLNGERRSFSAQVLGKMYEVVVVEMTGEYEVVMGRTID